MAGTGTIEVIARGVYVRGDSLLLCHSTGADNTFLPGGHVEFEEGARRALCREIDEELGVAARAGDFLGCVEHSFLQDGVRHCEINLVFEVSIPGLADGADPESMEGKLEFLWVPLEGLGDSRLEPSALIELLPEWLSGRYAGGWASTHGG